MAEKSRGENWRGKQPQQKASARPEPRSRKKAVLILLGLMLVVIGVIVGLARRAEGSTNVYGMSIVLNEIEDPHWPVPAWARQDGDRAMPVGAEVVKPLQEQNRNSILTKLSETDLNTQSRPTLVFLMASVIIGSDGPQLITSDAKSLDSDRRTLPLLDVLEKLRKLKDNCFLVLDLRTINDPWLTGLGSIDGYETYAFLDAYFKEHASNRLAVLCYCNPGLPPLTTTEWNGNIFALALQEALLGHANRWNKAGDTEVNVTSEEVAYYVKERIAGWCKLTGIEPELPRYHASQEFILRTASTKVNEELALKEPTAYPPDLIKSWKWFEERQRTSQTDHAPLAQRRLQTALLRTESRWLNNAFTDVELKQLLADFKPDLDRYQNQIAVVRKMPDVSAFSVKPPTLTPEQVKVLQPFDDALQKWQQQLPLKPEEWDGLVKAQKDAILNHPEYAVNKIITTLLSASDLSIAQIRRLSMLVPMVKPNTYFELQLLRFVDSIPDDQLQYWQASFKTIFECMRAAEQAVPSDPRAWRYLQPAITENDKRFQQTLLDIANTNFVSSERAVRVRTLASIKQTYNQLQEIGQSIDAALSERDACQAELPSLAQFDAADPLLASTLQSEWDKLIPLVKQLIDKLKAPETLTLSWASDLRSTTELVKERRLILNGIRRNLPKTSPYFITLNTLPSSGWPIDERLSRLTSTQGPSKELATAGIKPLTAVPARLIETNPLEAPRITPQHFHRLRRATNLLELANHPQAPPASQALGELMTRYDPQSTQKLRQLLGSIWTTSATQLVASDRLWYVPAFGEDAEKDPVFQDYLSARTQYLEWLASTRMESWAQTLDKTHKELAVNIRELSDRIRRITP
jgi:hypothetical protein